MELDTLLSIPVDKTSVVHIDTYTMYTILKSAGGTVHHYQIRNAVERDFEPHEYGVQTMISASVSREAFKVYVLDSDQAAVLAGSFGGAVGIRARRKLLETLKTMRQQRDDARKEAYVLAAHQAAQQAVSGMNFNYPLELDELMSEAATWVVKAKWSKAEQESARICLSRIVKLHKTVGWVKLQQKIVQDVVGAVDGA